VILAGGVGSRFWPASTRERPKQLLPLGGERPLIEDTFERAAALVGESRVRIVAGGDLVRPFRDAVPALRPDHFLVEPRPRSTCPALVWAASELEAADPGCVMISLHADHVISPFDLFARTVDRGVEAARARGSLVCLGLAPSRPETGYGYIEAGPEIAPGVHPVRRFVEKPDRQTAARYLADGSHLWNTGIFVWRAADLLRAARAVARELDDAMPRLDAGDVPGFFDGARPVSVDVGVLERWSDVEVATCDFRWDDVGTWTALARTRASDAAGNVLVGRIDAVDAADNVAWCEEGRVVLFGVRDLVVVRAGEEMLVTTRERAGDLKDLLERLREEEA
jgi:mannose-1-phosphate guanylyltransferase